MIQSIDIFFDNFLIRFGSSVLMNPSNFIKLSVPDHRRIAKFHHFNVLQILHGDENNVNFIYI